MKGTLLPLVVLVGTFTCARADVIARWTFNDTNAPVTAPPPAVGTGTALPIGGTTAAYVDGATPDNTNTPNKAWSTKSYPAATVGTKTAGAQFNVSTFGYHDISLGWYQQNSATASRYVRLQYTLDGAAFTDGAVIAITKDGSYTNITVSLSGIPGATNNPLFGFRLVSEFENTASGAGAASYVATTDGLGLRRQWHHPLRPCDRLGHAFSPGQLSAEHHRVQQPDRAREPIQPGAAVHGFG